MPNYIKPKIITYISVSHHKYIIISGEKWQNQNATLLTVVGVNLVGIGTQKAQTCLTDVYEPVQVHKSCQVSWHGSVYVRDVNQPSFEGIPAPLQQC
jgi:hypothetical protein